MKTATAATVILILSISAGCARPSNGQRRDGASTGTPVTSGAVPSRSQTGDVARYSHDPAVVALGRQIPFTLLIPGEIPGSPALISATQVVPPPGNALPKSGDGPASIVQIEFGTAHRTILSVTEMVGYNVGHLPGTAVTIKTGVSGLALTEPSSPPLYTLAFLEDGVNVSLSSSSLSGRQLITVASNMARA